MPQQDVAPAEDCSVVVTHAISDGEWRPIYWEVRNSAMGELVLDAIWDHGQWRDPVTRTLTTPADALSFVPEEVITTLQGLIA